MAKRPRDADLECPVCFEQLRAPIFQCVNGHIVCRRCLVRIENSSRKCPTCRVVFTDRIRCLQADRRAEELTDTRPQSKHETAPSNSADIPSAADIFLPTRSTRNADPLSESAKQGIAKWSVEKCPRGGCARVVRPELPLLMRTSIPCPSRPPRDEQFDICVYKVADCASWLWPAFEGIPCTELYQFTFNYLPNWPNIYGSLDEFLKQCARAEWPPNVTALQNCGLKVVTAGSEPRAPFLAGRCAIYVAEEQGVSDALTMTLNILVGFVEWLGLLLARPFRVHFYPHISARAFPDEIENCTFHAPRKDLPMPFWQARPCSGNRFVNLYMINSPTSNTLRLEIHSTIPALRKSLVLNFPDAFCSDEEGEQEARFFRFVLLVDVPQLALVHKLVATLGGLATRVVAGATLEQTFGELSEIRRLPFLHF